MTDAPYESGSDWLRVRPLCEEPRSVEFGELPDYHLLVAGVGYEQRSRFVLENLEGSVATAIGLVFDSHQVLSFEDNIAAFRRVGAHTPLVDTRVVYKTIQSHIFEVAARLTDSPMRIACDVSVLDRTRLAAAVMAISDCEFPIDVDFLYAPAVYSPPPEVEPPLVVRNPVHERLSGWADDPSMPTSLIVGLGYEREKAVGAIEFLEPATTWVFVPYGVDERYNESVRASNSALWSIHEPDGQLAYDVLDPFGTFVTLESLIYGLKERFRPVVVPFGPKIFTVCSIVAALVHAPHVSVWRLSAGLAQVPVNRVPDGSLTGIRLQARRTP